MGTCFSITSIIIRSFPEVDSVFGAVDRSDSPTDDAPLDMYDTTVMLKPLAHWRTGIAYEKLIAEMDAKLQFPGLSNTWTMPVENRLDMQLTGIKTPIGMKVQGASVCAQASSPAHLRCRIRPRHQDAGQASSQVPHACLRPDSVPASRRAR